MQPKRIELFIKNKTEDMTEVFRGYTKLKVESVYGNLWLFKDQLQMEDAVKIEAGMTYSIGEFVQIQNMGLGKSKPTLYGYLF
jgi:hypothetical protein